MSPRRNSPILPIWLVISGILLLIVAATWGLSSKRSTPTSTPPQIVSDVPRISVVDAKAAYDKGTAIFVDVRDTGSYAAKHIPGALSVPFEQIDSHYHELDPDSWVITY